MDSIITSLQNQRVKDAVHLRDRRKRERQGRFLIDGLREIERALTGGILFESVYYCETQCGEAQLRLIRELTDTSTELLRVTPSVFGKLAFGDRSEGVLAVATTPRRTLGEIPIGEDALVVVLESVEKPGNVGAVLRTADAAGATAMVVIGRGADLYNPNTIRASLGAVFTVPVCHADGQETLRWLAGHDILAYAARVDGSVDYANVSYRQPCALVLGSEAHGLSDLWQGDAIRAISLPMHGAVDSLNISTTAAVLLYEALRQRRASNI